MVYNIDILKWNLRPFQGLKCLVENPFKNVFYSHFDKQMHNNIFISKQNHYHMKEEDIL
jgi:hypothetical protein